MQMYVCRTLGHPESMIVYCVFLCSGRHSCRVQVVYRMSPRCSVSVFYAKEEDAFRTQRAEPFIVRKNS